MVVTSDNNSRAARKADKLAAEGKGPVAKVTTQLDAAGLAAKRAEKEKGLVAKAEKALKLEAKLKAEKDMQKKNKEGDLGALLAEGMAKPKKKGK